MCAIVATASRICFGVSPIAWANDDLPELGGDTPLATILSDAHELGFSGVELGNKFPRDSAKLPPLLASYGLELICGWYGCSLLRLSADEEIAALQPHLSLLKAADASLFMIAETSNAIHGQRSVPLSQTPHLTAREWVQFGERLSELAAYLGTQDMRLCYHHHLGTVVENADDLDAFLSHTSDAVGLTLDTGHAALGGIDWLKVIHQHPRRITHVHCKDYRPVKTATRHSRSFLDGVLAGMFTVPGDGAIDYAPLMQALAEIDYRGWIVIEAEQDPELAPPRPYAELGLRTLKTAATTAGLL